MRMSLHCFFVLFEITGCRKPCKYKRYNFLGDKNPSAFKSEHFIFSLWAVSSKTKIETEELIYPSSSLVAEFGGILSLFLGFSFISLWDKFSSLRRLRYTNFFELPVCTQEAIDIWWKDKSLILIFIYEWFQHQCNSICIAQRNDWYGLALTEPHMSLMIELPLMLNYSCPLIEMTTWTLK